ncbi:MAG: T9SS type A sorting domain-containing protein [Fimbriimonadaceae bacterium]|nr:T9SS type A sorting domain-containing protein [Chitinophagales bacterium]
MQTKLLAYSSATSLFLAFSQHADAQVIYTDIDPDIIVDAPAGIYNLDLDNDATIDFIFSASSVGLFTVTDYGANVLYATHAVMADPQNLNSIAATTAGVSGFAYPYVFAESANISAGLQFKNTSFQSLAFNFHALVSSSVYNTIHAYGNWLDGETDKFIGLKLIKDGNTHYGWARLDVATDNKSFTIKDYAYEATAGVLIHTDIMDAIDDVPADKNISIFSFNNVLTISFGENINYPTTLFIFDITGNIILQQHLFNTKNEIDLSKFAASVYIVKVQTEKSVNTVKIQVIK